MSDRLRTGVLAGLTLVAIGLTWLAWKSPSGTTSRSGAASPSPVVPWVQTRIATRIVVVTAPPTPRPRREPTATREPYRSPTATRTPTPWMTCCDTSGRAARDG